MNAGLTVGRLAAAAGAKSGTIRYYERLGLLPRAVRTSAGYRVFPAEAIRRLSLVRAAKDLGFSLRDIAGFLTVRDAGGKPCQDVRAAGEQLMKDLDVEIARLRTRRRRIRRTLTAWDEILSTTPIGNRAHLLERLTAGTPPRSDFDVHPVRLKR
jgi:DNA-binding transcriptional MerR regulator